MRDNGLTVHSRSSGALTIRPAEDADGPAIGKLFAEAGVDDSGVDWSAVSGWLVAEDDGRIVGAAQPVPTAPYGYLEQFVIHPDYQGGDRLTLRRGTVTGDLYVASLAVCKQAGAQIVLSVVPDARVVTLLQQYGSERIGTFPVMRRRL